MAWVSVATAGASLIGGIAAGKKKGPDVSGQINYANQAAGKASNVADQEFGWSADERAKNSDLLSQFLSTTNDITKTNAQNAASDRSRYENTFRPLEDNLVKQANEYATPARYQREMGAAMADTGAAFDKQRTNAQRDLESFGIDPSTTRYAGLDAGYRAAKAASQAAAGVAARNNVDATQRQLQLQAIQLGQALPGQSLAEQQAALQAGGAGQSANLATSQLNANLPSMTALPFLQEGVNANASGANAALGQANSTTAAQNGASQNFNRAVDTSADLFKNLVPVFDKTAPAPGAVPKADGRVVDPTGRSDGSGIDDKVPAMLSTDEYVIPADVVKHKGVEFFDRLVEKYHVPAATQRQAVPA